MHPPYIETKKDNKKINIIQINYYKYKENRKFLWNHLHSRNTIRNHLHIVLSATLENNSTTTSSTTFSSNSTYQIDK